MTTPLANASAIRAGGYSSRVMASFYAPPTPIASGTLLGIVAPPRVEIGVTYVTGAYSDVRAGMEIVFSDAITGAFKGRTTITYSTIPINASVLPVREFALSTLNIGAGDVFQIYEDWRIHDRLVAATEAFQPSYLDYTDEGLRPPPIANSGGHSAGWVDPGKTFATVLMTGSTSYTVDPASVSGVSHVWTLPGGIAFASGSADTDADPVLQANVGQWLVYHAVTDIDNGKTTVQHVIVIVCDPTHPPHRGNLTQYSSTIQSGFGWTLDVFQGATDLTTIPDGCWCILWTEETVAHQSVSYRNAAPGRSTILGVGITRRDTSGYDAPRHTINFEVIAPIARIKEITSYSKEMIEAASPAAWDQVFTLGVKRGILQILLFYLVLNQAGCDIVFDSAFFDYRYPGLELQRSDFLSQIGVLVRGQDAVFTCDRTGRIDIHTHMPYVPLADRAAITKSWDFLPSDILSYEFTREHFNGVQLFKANGFAGGMANNAPVYSLYPSASPGEGLATPTQALLIVDPTDPQGDLNDRNGRYGAEADMTYIDADGIQWRAFPLKLKLRGVYNFFDFSKQYADFSQSILNKRGIDLTGLLFYLTSISVTSNPGTGAPETDVTFNVATYAPGSPEMTYIPPTNGALPVSTTPVLPPVTVVPVSGALGRGTQTVIGIGTDNFLYITHDFNTPSIAGGPTWTRVALGNSGNILDAVQSAFVTTRVIIVTDDTNGIYTVDDISSPTPTVTLRKTLNRTILIPGMWRMVDASFGADYIVVVSCYNSDATYPGTWYTYSTDGGTTWSTETQITANDSASANGSRPGLYVSSYAPGCAYMGAYSSNAPVGSIYKTSGTFASPTNTGIATDAPPSLFGCIHVPYANNSSESELYYGHNDPFSPVNVKIYRANGASLTDVTFVIGGLAQALQYNRALHTCPTDNNTVVAATSSTVGMTSTGGVAVSRNKGGAWTQVTPGTTTQYVEAELVDTQSFYAWGFSGALGYSGDFGASGIDERGPGVSAFPGAGRMVRIMGGSP